MSGPELLAPAGNWDALTAAVQNGADAVYLGATSFNARQSAANFEPRELVRAVDYAHVRDVRVYATVNVLVADRELEAVTALLGDLYNAGVDAVIVQDLGLIRLIRDLLPGLEVHASTQTTAHNLPTLELLKGLGVRRAVLARELSLDEIAFLRERGGLELEIFVHGALCFSYSGQCLMSSLVGGRSGNRGRCTQPCSLRYTLYRDGVPAEPAAPGPYVLRPRDLNLSVHLPELVRAGVDAMKIEGRMRRPEYVATVVRIYRKLLDRLAAGHFHVTEDEQRDLAQVFNRGYSTGYFFGRPGRMMMAYSRPSNRGMALGRVRRYLPVHKTVEIILDAPLHTGDTVEVWVSAGGRVSTVVRDMRVHGRPTEAAAPGTIVTVPLAGRARPGDRVFKTEDAVLGRRARATFVSAREQKNIPLSFRVSVRAGAPLRLEVTDPAGFTATAETRVPAAQARHHPLTVYTLKVQFGRLGNTPYVLGDLHCELEGQVMLPLRELNEVRRRALERLEGVKIAVRRPQALDPDKLAARVRDYVGARTAARAARGGRPVLTVSVGDPAGLEAAVDAGADVVYFPGEGLGAPHDVGSEELSEAARVCRRGGATLVLWWPRILHDRELPRWFGLTGKSGPLFSGVLAGNAGAFSRLKAHPGLVADYPLNIFNRLTLCLLAELGAARVILSPELTLDQVRELALNAPVPVEVLVHGALPVMVSEHCVVGSLMDTGGGDGSPCTAPCRTGRFTLKDRVGLDFLVGTDTACRMHIFNAKDLCAVEQIPELFRCGVSSFRVEGRLRTAGYLHAVVAIYREVVDRCVAGGPDWQVPPKYKERLQALSPQGLTSGHYFRGVL